MPININGTTGISGVDGSAGTPSIQGSDTNTGVFFPAADTAAITTGGAERVRVDSSGNVGIGTSSPAANNRMTLNASSGNNGFEIQNSGDSNRGGRLVATGSAASGTFAVNTTSSGYALTFGIDGTERARIDTSGNFRVGDANYSFTAGASGQSRVTVNNDYCFQFTRKNGTGVYVYFTYNTTDTGTISTNGTTTSYNTSSDYRLKENVQPMAGALAKVTALKPCTYTWKADGTAGEGFIAHELAEVVPDAVTGEKDAVNEDGSIKPQGIDTSFLVATLTAAIQELNAKVEAQAAEIAILKGAA